MRVLMTSYYTGPKGKPDLAPGDIHDFDEAEGERVIAVGGGKPAPAEEKPVEPVKPADLAKT